MVVDVVPKSEQEKAIGQYQGLSTSQPFVITIKLDQYFFERTESVTARAFITYNSYSNFSESTIINSSYKTQPTLPPPTTSSELVLPKEPPQRYYPLAEQAIEIKPKTDDFRVGQQIELEIKTPFSPCECCFVVKCNGRIVSSYTFHMTTNTSTVRLYLTEDFSPNIWLQFYAVGQTMRLSGKELAPDAPKQPSTAFGEYEIQVPPLHRELTVSVQPEQNVLEPGGKTNVLVKVNEAISGAPISKPTEVALVVVDEAVLALSGYSLSNPLKTFYALRKKMEGGGHASLRKQMLIEAWDPILQNIVKVPTPEEMAEEQEEDKKKAKEEEDEEVYEEEVRTATVDILDTAGQEVRRKQKMKVKKM